MQRVSCMKILGVHVDSNLDFTRTHQGNAGSVSTPLNKDFKKCRPSKTDEVFYTTVCKKDFLLFIHTTFS